MDWNLGYRDSSTLDLPDRYCGGSIYGDWVSTYRLFLVIGWRSISFSSTGLKTALNLQESETMIHSRLAARDSPSLMKLKGANCEARRSRFVACATTAKLLKSQGPAKLNRGIRRATFISQRGGFSPSEDPPFSVPFWP